MQRTVDMAVKLGLRSYALPGTARDYDPESNESLADFVKRQNLGSFTLGPIEVNALELSNVAATLASGGTWCPPNPIDKVFDRNGKEVSVTTETCEQVVPEGLANTLANAMSKDDQARHRGRLGRFGRLGPADVRQDRHHRGAPVVGLPRLHQRTTPRPTTSTTTRPTPSDLCSFPLRQCGSGDLFGGNEPARTWFTAMKPIATLRTTSRCRRPIRATSTARPGSKVPSVAGLNQDTARQRLKDAGFQVADQATPVNSSSPYGTVVGTSPSGQTVPGSIITIQISNGIPPAPPPPPPGLPPGSQARPPAGRLDGRRDPRSAADHRAGARSATTAAATTAVTGRDCAVRLTTPTGDSRCARDGGSRLRACPPLRRF